MLSAKATQSGKLTQVLLPKVMISEEVKLVGFLRKNLASHKIDSGKNIAPQMADESVFFSSTRPYESFFFSNSHSKSYVGPSATRTAMLIIVSVDASSSAICDAIFFTGDNFM